MAGVMVLNVSCKGNAVTNPSNATGAPYELIISVSQERWDGEIGDTLRSIFLEPVEMINQREPLFDVLRINPEGLTGFIRQHRNVLIVQLNSEVKEPASYAQYDAYSKPQIVVTVVAPNTNSMVRYLTDNRKELQDLFESVERNRSVTHNRAFQEKILSGDVAKMFGMKMDIPKGYRLRTSSGDNFMWISNELPLASQGIVIYTYPYTGRDDLLTENIIKMRNEFVANIPGPSEGSFMATSFHVDPEVGYIKIHDRSWVETRGFWDVEGDFMGGPFINYTTVHPHTNQVIAIDFYVYSPQKPKRNLLRSLEHIIYSVDFPEYTE